VSHIEFLEIIDNHPIVDGIYKLNLKLPPGYPCPLPGQFVNLYLNNKSLLLPRPISVCDWIEDVLTLVYAVVGKGTEIISGYKAGTIMRCSTPMGNGFSIEGGPYLLIGGGVGIPPLVYLSKHLPEKSELRVLLGYRSEPFLTGDFPCTVEVATDGGLEGFKGTVIDLLSQTGVADDAKLFACGPRPMLKALTSFAQERGLALQISMEERMGCGYGACVGCICKTVEGNRKVCEDGPVFQGNEVVWDG
jgi:dihydroorotate dehydrogenase electron transfer subunit